MSFVSCTTSHAGLGSFLESIEHDFIKALIKFFYNSLFSAKSWQNPVITIERMIEYSERVFPYFTPATAESIVLFGKLILARL